LLVTLTGEPKGEDAVTSILLMGLTRFRQREIVETATRESTDVISEKSSKRKR
jgi:hypothetical protein